MSWVIKGLGCVLHVVKVKDCFEELFSSGYWSTGDDDEDEPENEKRFDKVELLGR